MFVQSCGRTLPSAGFLLSLVLSGFYAFGCLEFWSDDENSASDVFIQYAQKSLGENWSEKMNSKKYKKHSGYSTLWEKEIVSSTQQWSPEKAREFLNILESRVGVQNTCYLLARSLSHFKNIPHNRDKMSQDILQNFKERIAFYDEYMGEEETTEMMRKSLAGFTEGILPKIKELVYFLEDYFKSKELVIRLLKRHPQAFSLIWVDEIQPILNFMETLIGHDTLTEMMTRKKEDSKHGRYLSLPKLKVLQNILQPLMNEMTVVSLKHKNSIHRDLMALAELNYDRLVHIQKQVSFWVTYSGPQVVARIMKKSLSILFDEGLYKLGRKAQAAERESQNRKSVIKFTRQHPELFVTSNETVFLDSFRKWLSPPPPQKPDTRPKPQRKNVRSIKSNPAQMILALPERE